MSYDHSERYARHYLLNEIGEAGQKRLHGARVLIVGVGGLGSPVAMYLAAAGVGTLGLVDDDVVSVSNLQRQVLYTEAQVGLSKVRCAAERLQAMNSELQVVEYPTRLTKENADEIIGNYDVVVDGCDNYATRYLMDEVCAAQGKPYVYGAIGEFTGQVCVFNMAGGLRYVDLYPDKEYLCGLPKRVMGVMGAVPGVVGSMQACEVIKIVTQCEGVLKNRLLSINLMTMEVTTMAL